MKHILTLFLSLLLIPVAYGQGRVKIGDLYYNLTSSSLTAEVTYDMSHSNSSYPNLSGSLSIPETVVYNGETYRVTAIGYYAFYDCSGLTGSLTIPNSVTSIANGAFYECSGLTGSLTIPNSVTSIGKVAFSGCRGFTGSLTIGNSVTSIGESAFSGCSGFSGSLTIPNSVTSIGNDAFYSCSGFTGSLTIPNSVTEIGNYAFRYCSGFTGSLTIGNSVTEIGNDAFDRCDGLTEILSLSKTPPLAESDAFNGLYSKPLFVPAQSIPLYKSAPEWENFSNIEPLPIYATGIVLNKSELSLSVGMEETLIATITPEDATIKVVWVSANEKIVSVNQSGRIQALAVGNTVITASCGDVSATCVVRVNPAPGTVVIDGISYNYSGNTAVVTGCASNVGQAVIADKITVSFGAETIEFNVAGIADGAFENCPQLRSVVIPSSVNSIGENAFANCKQLSGISCGGSTPPSCAASAFSNTNCRILLVNENSVSTYSNAGIWKEFEFILGLFGKTDNVGVETINSLAYLSIDNEATVIPSDNYTGLTSVQIPEQIPVTTLSGLSVLSEVNKISRNAFYNCQKIEKITLPSTITNIEANAFANCTDLKSVSCYAIKPPVCASNAFSGANCEELHVPYHSLSAYQASDVWKNFKNIYGDLDLYEYNKMLFWLDPQTLQGELVSVDKSLEKGDIPEIIVFEGISYPITAISEGAFKGCENINAITIPSSILIIDANIFAELKNLKNLSFSDGSQLLYINGKIVASNLEILTIGRELYFGETTIDGKKLNCNPVFANYSALTSLNFGKNIKTIVRGMFEDCRNIRSITIPENVGFIGDNAFRGCVSLRSINLEDSSNPITIESATSGTGTGTTFGSAPIETIYLGRNVEYIGTELSPFKNLETLMTLTIGNKTTSINNYLFYGCRNIDMMSVPSSVTYIGGYSFYDCSTAKLLTISRSVETIGEYAFYNCRSLTTLTIPSSVVTIGDYAFRSCSGLTSISIGDGVKKIGNYAFLDCYMASNISIGNSVQTIGDNAFYNCQSLANIIIPNSVVSIGANAFALCQGAKEITIGIGVKSIGERAFADCDYISNVNCLSSVPAVAYDNTFTNYDATLHVPQNALTSYWTATCWKNFKTIENDLAVEIPATGIMISPSAPAELKVGESLQLTATVSPENATDKTVTWESSDRSVASVNAQGLVTAMGPGTAVITASDIYGHNAFVIVTVIPNEEDGVESIFDESLNLHIFTINGLLIKKNATQEDLDTLSPGIYIIGGKKVIIR